MPPRHRHDHESPRHRWRTNTWDRNCRPEAEGYPPMALGECWVLAPETPPSEGEGSKYSALWLRNGLKVSQQQLLQRAAQAVEDADSAPSPILGLWAPNGEVTLTPTRTDSPAVVHLEEAYDAIMGTAPLRFLKAADKGAAIRMKFAHREVHEAFMAVRRGEMEEAEVEAALGGEEEESDAEEGESGAKDGDYTTPRSVRKGGMGTLLRISRGDEDFRRDDAVGGHYTVVVAVGRTALVYLKNLGRSVKLRPGSVLFFRPSFEYKVVWDPEDSAVGYHCVFTAYNCARAAAAAAVG